MPDEFDRVNEFKRSDLIDSKIKETNLHAMPFNCNMNK